MNQIALKSFPLWGNQKGAKQENYEQQNSSNCRKAKCWQIDII